MRAPRASRRSSSATARSTSTSESSGTPKMRPSAPKPQSSSSQRLKAASAAKLASASRRSACSTVTPKVGKSRIDSMPCASIAASRAAALLVLRAHRLQERRRGALALRDEHLLQVAGRRHQLEGGRREVMLLPGHEDGVLAGGVGHHLDGALAQRGSRWRAEGVARLVVVVVGVEDPEAPCGPPLWSPDRMASYHLTTDEARREAPRPEPPARVPARRGRAPPAARLQRPLPRHRPQPEPGVGARPSRPRRGAEPDRPRRAARHAQGGDGHADRRPRGQGAGRAHARARGPPAPARLDHRRGPPRGGRGGSHGRDARDRDCAMASRAKSARSSSSILQRIRQNLRRMEKGVPE